MAASHTPSIEAVSPLSAPSRSFRNARPNGYSWRFPHLLSVEA